MADTVVYLPVRTLVGGWDGIGGWRIGARLVDRAHEGEEALDVPLRDEGIGSRLCEAPRSSGVSVALKPTMAAVG